MLAQITAEHLGTIAVLAGLLVNFGGLVWGAAKIKDKVDSQEQLNSKQENRFSEHNKRFIELDTKMEAKLEQLSNHFHDDINVIRDRSADIDRRVSVLEDRSARGRAGDVRERSTD